MVVGEINSLLSRQLVIEHSPLYAVGRDGLQSEQQPIKVKPTPASAPHQFDSIEPYQPPYSLLAMPRKGQVQEIHPSYLKSMLKQIEEGPKDPRNYSELTRLEPRLV